MAVRLPITQSASFNGGAADYIDFGDRTDLDGAAQATWSFWTYYPSSVDVSGDIFARWGGTGATNGGWHIKNIGANVYLYAENPSGSPFVATNTYYLTPDTWQNTIVTYNAGAVAIYADGVSQGTSGAIAATTLTAPGVSTQVQVSRPSTASTVVTGYVSNPAYWAGTAATPTQVAEIYEAGRVHDLAFMATMPSPTFWAALDGNLDIVGGGTGTSTGVAYVTSTPPLIPGGTTLDYSSETPGGGSGAEAFGALGHGSSVASAALAGVPVVSDWCTLGTGQLLSQFHGKPKIEALLCAILEQGQEIEQALADLRDLNGLNYARGVLLDAVGYALGLPRTSLPNPTISDDGFRNMLRGAAAAKISGGTPDGMIRTALTLLAGAGGVTYSEEYPAGAYVSASGALTYEEGKAFARIVRRARPASVNYSFRYMPSVPGARVLVHSDHPSLPVYNIPEDGDTEPLLPEEDSGV